MKKSNFDRFFRDYHFVGCAVRSKNFIYLLGSELYEVEEGDEKSSYEIKKRNINIILDDPESSMYGSSTLTGFGRMHIAVSKYPTPHSVSVDLSGSVWRAGGGVAEMENDIAWDEEKGPQRGGVGKLKTIGGYVYGVGSRRSVCRREGPNHWIPVWNQLPLPGVKRNVEFNDYGFEDIDGFHTEDIYAAGGDGDVWHYDGERWRQLAFPSNMSLHNVCCGADGNVYICAQGGVTFKGRGDRWEKVSARCTDQWFNDVVWYQDKLWASNDYGIWQLGSKGFEQPELPSFVRASTGYLAAGDGVMVVAGMYGASMHDGKDWQSLADLVALYKQYGA